MVVVVATGVAPYISVPMTSALATRSVSSVTAKRKDRRETRKEGGGGGKKGKQLGNEQCKNSWRELISWSHNLVMYPH